MNLPVLGVVNTEAGLLLVFTTGESRLATELPDLARYIVTHNSGILLSDYAEVLAILERWPPDVLGPLPIYD